ncbi:MAG: metallophosphoesterase [Anaerolineae bacterium]|nr:metallophosphoesterase [Anaerolineae bacterium]
MKSALRSSIISVFAVFLSGLVLGSLVPLPETTFAQTADPVLVGAGDIANCSRTQDESTAQLLDNIAGTVFTLGDNVYPSGTLTQFNDCYGPTWGRHKDRTRPSPGNHDYNTAGAAGYYTYFGAAASPLDTNCTSNCLGYYSYDLGAWHIIVLNSETPHGVGSAQEQWLRAELAANQSVCILAYWHKPRFNSGFHGNNTGVQPFWDALYEYGADVILNGHGHIYERFAPQDPNGQADLTRGIREFIAGTGGASLNKTINVQPNSEVLNNTAYGVLKLTLHPTSYDWEFVPIAGQTFTDSGSSNCVGAGQVPTDTPTASDTPTMSDTSTPSHTPTAGDTPIATSTPTATATGTIGPSPTNTPTVTMTSAPTSTNTPGSSDLIFADGFESGNLSAWTSSSTDLGDLSVSTAAALIGIQGLRALIDDSNTIYVTDDRPITEPRYRARFYFDPNSIPMASGDAHFIFKGFVGTSTEVLRVEFRQFSGAYQLRAALLNDSSTWINTNWFAISDAAHSIELDWQAATAAGANNGSLTLWIDGVQQQVLTGVDNDTRRIDRARLGALTGIDAGTRGTYYFDAFESRRQNYIGP